MPCPRAQWWLPKFENFDNFSGFYYASQVPQLLHYNCLRQWFIAKCRRPKTWELACLVCSHAHSIDVFVFLWWLFQISWSKCHLFRYLHIDLIVCLLPYCLPSLFLHLSLLLSVYISFFLCLFLPLSLSLRSLSLRHKLHLWLAVEDTSQRLQWRDGG